MYLLGTSSLYEEIVVVISDSYEFADESLRAVVIQSGVYGLFWYTHFMQL